MLLRAHRFHGRNSLRTVYSNGQTARTNLLAIRVFENNRRKEYRCAVVVSKKTSKSAVTRNRIRRRIYEVIRKHSTDIVLPYDLVVTVFSDQVATMEAADLDATLHKLLQQAGVVK